MQRQADGVLTEGRWAVVGKVGRGCLERRRTQDERPAQSEVKENVKCREGGAGEAKMLDEWERGRIRQR